MPLLQLDVRTLLLVSSISYGLLALITVLTWRAYPAEWWPAIGLSVRAWAAQAVFSWRSAA